MSDAQVVFVVTIPTLTVLIGILINHGRFNDLSTRITDLRNDLNNRISDLRADTNTGFNRVDQRFSDMDALFTEKLFRVEQVLDARLKHLEEHRR